VKTRARVWTFIVIILTVVLLGPLGVRAGELKGSLPWVTILCRFADVPSTPFPREYFEELMGSAYPGLDHYWREVSYGNINLAGSIVVGWYDLPQPSSYYVYDDRAGIDRLLNDCVAAADPDVFFPGFYGVNTVFNKALEGVTARGAFGHYVKETDGVLKPYGIILLSVVNDFDVQASFAHEMGHAFGLQHSSSPNSTDLTSPWDIMSWGWFVPQEPAKFGMTGIHTIAYHKDLLGWIPAERKYIFVPEGGARTIWIERLALPKYPDSYLMAEIQSGNNGQFYTIEARQFAGYDQGGRSVGGGLPGEAIIVHHVDPLRLTSPAMILDIDGNGDNGDKGTMLVPGESLILDGIKVSVDGIEETGFLVTIDGSAALSGVQVVSPEAGEKWKVGTTQNIVWAGGNGNSIQVELSRNMGTSWEVISQSVPNSGSLRWQVRGTPTDRALIRVSDGTDKDISEPFTIKKRRRAR